MHPHGRQVCIVEASPADVLALQRKAQRLHQVQRATGIGTEPDDVAGVGWDLRPEEDDVEHA